MLVGGGRWRRQAAALLAAGAHVSASSRRRSPAEIDAGRRGRSYGAAFVPADLDGAWLVVAAATPEVNREVADAAEARRMFVNAVDDPANATAFLSGVVRRDGVTLAISTSGDAPALTALLREALDAVLPRDLRSWMWRGARGSGRMAARRRADGRAEAAAAPGAERALRRLRATRPGSGEWLQG